MGAFVPYSALYYQSRGLDLGQIGLVLAIGSLLGIVAAPAWGSVSDRLAGSPLVLLASAATAVAGLALLSAATSFQTVLGANSLMTVGIAGLLPIIDARTLETVASERSGYGPVRAWGSFGWVFSSLTVGFVIERVGLGAIFGVTGVGLILTAAIGMQLRPSRSVRERQSLFAGVGLLRIRILAVFLLGALLAWSSMAAVLDFLALRFDQLHAGTGYVGIAFAIAAAIEVPVMLRFPALAKRVRADRLLVAGAAILAARSLLSGVAMDPAVLVVAAGLGGVGYALFLVGGVTFVSEHVPPQLAATGQGLFQGVSISLSTVFAGVIGGALAGSIGIGPMFALSGLVGIVAIGIVAFATRPGAFAVARAADGARIGP
jgi:PPP family 3-phenylpropionic acid transporter